MDVSVFWTRVNILIKEKSMTQTELSVSCGFNPRRIQNLSGGNRLPDVHEGYLIAQALGTSVEYLITGENPVKPDISELEKTLNLALQQLKAL